jgi:peptidoglycan/xylan/chitin deacetylase (PgdA/CDA1 family)
MADVLIRFPGGKKKALTFSYDDGVTLVIRLMEIFDKHGLKGTFNLNSGQFGSEDPNNAVHKRLKKDEIAKLYANSNHEAALHAYAHPHLETLPAASVMQQIIADRVALEEMLHVPIRGMAYPFGSYSDEVVEVLRLAGVEYCRTVKSTDSFDIPGDWLRLPATCHHRSPNLMDLARRFADDDPRLRPYLFYVWGHSYEFDADDNWNVIEEFAAYAGGRSDVWYATNIEIFDYLKAFSRLEFTVMLDVVKNPTATDIFARIGTADVSIPAGKTVAVK